ncbi:protocadherin delta 1 [Paragonimus westermani]|uniref:Protocadherin delta 1 n=1 Tax=Paragonimus westermani TaxID=34504 RepID=A0A5J4NEL0_9TREM|nr:protocadherin delta 1 [Paragonimus westermani]
MKLDLSNATGPGSLLMDKLWLLLACTVLLRVHGLLSSVEHEYRINEEIPIGSKVGNIVEDIFPKMVHFGLLKSSFDKASMKEAFSYKILNTADIGANAFDVRSDGWIIVTKRIDREQLCPPEKNDALQSLENLLLRNEDFMLQRIQSTSEQFIPTEPPYCLIILRLRVVQRQYDAQNNPVKNIEQQPITVQLRIFVSDINDNSPHWPGHLKRFHVTFRDGDPVGERRAVPPASDPDAGVHGKLNYELTTLNELVKKSTPFSLIEHPTDGLYLYATKQIDREEQEKYQFILKATDQTTSSNSGRGQFTASLLLDVHIEDINDNTPLFTQPIFTPSSPIPENTAVGTTVLLLNATDADTGINGEFRFGFSKQHAWLPAETIARQFFDVRSNGQIVVRKPLNVDIDQGTLLKLPRRQSISSETNRVPIPHSDFIPVGQTRGTVAQFRFQVVVEDEAVRPYTRSSEATVILTVTDENDEAPVIDVQPMVDIFGQAPLVSNADLTFLSVTENQPAGTIVAAIRVYDPDFDGTDHVECRLQSTNFTLVRTNPLHESSELNAFTIPVNYRLQTAIELDREQGSLQSVLISCTDVVGHLTERNLTVHILDQNDNPPVFILNEFAFQVEENAPPGTKLRRVEKPVNTVLQQLPTYFSTSFIYQNHLLAVDPDFGPNAEVVYRLTENDKNVSDFKIDPNTGILSTAVTFDHEARTNYLLQVVAVDQGVPQRTGTANIKPEYTFHILENQPESTQIGRVSATDVDSEDFGPIHYFLSNDLDALIFHMDQRTGSLRSRQLLDRERQARYVFRVLARDGNAQISQTAVKSIKDVQLTSTATVTVVVDDDNDNWPLFVSPNATANTLAIAVDETLGHRLAYVQATDADEGENALISYHILSGNTNGLFGLDKATGLLYLAGTPGHVLLEGRSAQLKPPNKTDNQEHGTVNTIIPSFHSLVLEACDHGKPPKQKCTTFKNLKIFIKNIRDGEFDALERDRNMASTKVLQASEKEDGEDLGGTWSDGVRNIAPSMDDVRNSSSPLGNLPKVHKPVDHSETTIKTKHIFSESVTENSGKDGHIESQMYTEERPDSVENSFVTNSRSDSRYQKIPQQNVVNYRDGVHYERSEDTSQFEHPLTLENPLIEQRGPFPPAIQKRRSMISNHFDDYQGLDYLGLVSSTVLGKYPSIYSPNQYRFTLSPTTTNPSIHLPRSPVPQEFCPDDSVQLTRTHRLSGLRPLIAPMQQGDRFVEHYRISHLHSRSQPQPVDGTRNARYSVLSPIPARSVVTTVATAVGSKPGLYAMRTLKVPTFRLMTKSVQHVDGSQNDLCQTRFPIQSHTYYDIRQPDQFVFNNNSMVDSVDKNVTGTSCRLSKSKSQQIGLIPDPKELTKIGLGSELEEHGATLMNAEQHESGPKDHSDSAIKTERTRWRSSRQPDPLWQTSHSELALPRKMVKQPSPVRTVMDNTRYIPTAYHEASFV